MSHYHRLTVSEVREETSDARSLRLAIPPELAQQFAYKPGQFITLRVPCGDKPVLRCYSASSCPALGEELTVTIKRVAGGRASNWLCGCLRAGDTLEVAPPAGLFTPANYDGDFLLFAGGSGITPVISILKTVLASGSGRVRMLYANRDERSVIFAQELARLSREHPTRLQVIHWLDSVQGIASQAQIGQFALGWEGAQCFICGPSAFMEHAAAALKDLHLPPQNVHIERFVSLPDEDASTALPPPSANDLSSTITVVLDGKTHEVTAQPGQVLIEAMEAAGLKPPYSCRSGACAACMCTLESGTVAMRSNLVLDQHDLAAGWVLACQSQATSEHLCVRFPN